MHKYRLAFLLVFAPSMVTSGIERIKEAGRPPLLGVFEIALAVAICAGAGKEIREGRRRRAAGE